MNQVHKAYIECRRIAYIWYNASRQDEAAQLAVDKMIDSLQDMVRGIEESAYGEAVTTFNEAEPTTTNLEDNE